MGPAGMGYGGAPMWVVQLSDIVQLTKELLYIPNVSLGPPSFTGSPVALAARFEPVCAKRPVFHVNSAVLGALQPCQAAPRDWFAHLSTRFL